MDMAVGYDSRGLCDQKRSYQHRFYLFLMVIVPWASFFKSQKPTPLNRANCM